MKVTITLKSRLKPTRTAPAASVGIGCASRSSTHSTENEYSGEGESTGEAVKHSTTATTVEARARPKETPIIKRPAAWRRVGDEPGRRHVYTGPGGAASRLRARRKYVACAAPLGNRRASRFDGDKRPDVKPEPCDARSELERLPAARGRYLQGSCKAAAAIVRKSVRAALWQLTTEQQSLLSPLPKGPRQPWGCSRRPRRPRARRRSIILYSHEHRADNTTLGV